MCRALMWVGISAILILQGCATMKPGDTVAPTYITETPLHKSLDVSDDAGWWRVAFKLDRPNPEETRWYLDLLLAHRVIAPVLVAHEKDLLAWRFHRRAGNDATGHQFSFIFFSNRDIANEIYREVQNNPLLAEMKQAGDVKQDTYSDTTMIAKPLLEDTSDQSWSEVMQTVWPVYINGVSQMWLMMIDIYSRQLPRDGNDDSLAALEEFYKRINDEITTRWRQEGQHAFLHHLNAIFGYEPLLIRDISEKRF